jgi:hypothetical protein
MMHELVLIVWATTRYQKHSATVIVCILLRCVSNPATQLLMLLLPLCAVAGVADGSATALCKTESTSSIELAADAQAVSTVLYDC